MRGNDQRGGDWLALLVGQALAMKVPKQSHGRLIQTQAVPDLVVKW
jgi:hypothetical protein